MARRIAMPESVVIGPHTYSLKADKAAIDDDRVKTRTDTAGLCLTWEQRILVDSAPRLGPTQQRETVLHECLHAVFDVVGLSHDLGGNQITEEAILQRLDSAVLSLLRANPALVSWLTAQD